MMLQKWEKGTLNPNIIMTFAVFGSSQFFWLALPLSEGMTVMGGERNVFYGSLNVYNQTFRVSSSSVKGGIVLECSIMTT